MMYRRQNNAAIADWQDATAMPVQNPPRQASAAIGPSDTESMVSRFFPLGRLRPGPTEPDAARTGGSSFRITTFPNRDAARDRRTIAAGQSRGAVSVGTCGKAIPACRVWGIPDIS